MDKASSTDNLFLFDNIGTPSGAGNNHHQAMQPEQQQQQSFQPSQQTQQELQEQLLSFAANNSNNESGLQGLAALQQPQQQQQQPTNQQQQLLLQMPQQPQQQAQEQQPQADLSNSLAGYPTLVQQYLQDQLLQQQQQQQQQLAQQLMFANATQQTQQDQNALYMNQVASANLQQQQQAPQPQTQQQLLDINQLFLFQQSLQGVQAAAQQLSSASDLQQAQQLQQQPLDAFVANATTTASNTTNTNNNASGLDMYAQNGLLGPWSTTSAGLMGKMAAVDTVGTETAKPRKLKKRPKDRPKRPLSAYNIFFKEERQRILADIPDSEAKTNEGSKTPSRKRKKNPHGKIGFESLAKVIGQRWQDLSPDQVDYYKKQADEDMVRYKKEMEVYLSKQGKEQGKGGVHGEESTDEPSEKKLKSSSSEVDVAKATTDETQTNQVVAAEP